MTRAYVGLVAGLFLVTVATIVCACTGNNIPLGAFFTLLVGVPLAGAFIAHTTTVDRPQHRSTQDRGGHVRPLDK